MQNRRNFLKQSSLIALAPTVPGFLANFANGIRPEKDDRVLVVIQLDGGNDGVNTVVPYTDEGYKKYRNKLVIETPRLVKLNDELGFNPAMRSAAKLWEDQQLAILPSVGYPNPNRSHDVSMAIWQTCRFTTLEHNSHGWLGQTLDTLKPDSDGAPSSIAIGDRQPPIALQGRTSVAASISSLKNYRLNNASKASAKLAGSIEPSTEDDLAAFLQRSQTEAYSLSAKTEAVMQASKDSVRYPGTRLGQDLKTIASLLKTGFGTRVYYAIQNGYDTHAAQQYTHADLLSSLSRSVTSFLADLKAAKLEDRVVVMCFSEFGRRVDENGSAGTDHGSAGLLMLAGSKVKGGVHGGYSSLEDLEDGGLKVRTDFRSVYATVLKDWLNCDSQPALSKKFETLDLFKTK